MMDAPGNYALTYGGGTDFAITQPATYTGDVLDQLDGMATAMVQLDFRPGSGGTTVKAYVQTSIDGGATWLDIACCAFPSQTPVQAERVCIGLEAGVSGAWVSATEGTLADNQVVDGLLGNMLRVKIVSTGTWTNTFLGARCCVA
jgi:hypothetical protein